MSRHIILICQSTGCLSIGAGEVLRGLEKEIAKLKLNDSVLLRPTGCHGFCQQGPTVLVEPDDIFYVHVSEEDVREIVSSHLLEGRPVSRLFYRHPATGKAIPHHKGIPFFQEQKRFILRRCGLIDPERIEDYLEKGGYLGLRRVLEMNPEQVIEQVKRSGLRGRSGGGFPTWRKWESCRSIPSDKKFVICNANEGDPGSFMDRAILESDPFSVIEGLTIAGYAVGADEGFIYICTEYSLAVKRIRSAIRQAEEHGYLGRNILGSGFDFRISAFEGMGAFVCGEETALIASIEGRRGMPRPRPPYPTEKGLYGKPTVINNVKTLASVAFIFQYGVEGFSSLGTERSKGTAVFSLIGKAANCGLVEVPLGTTLEEVIFKIGGGIAGGKAIKAVQTGGPLGGVLPPSLLHLPLDYESFAQAGSVMGSGGMIVCDEDDCMVDLAKFFLSFTQAESCGKCTPCRIGTKLMLDILERICRGEGSPEDIDQLQELAYMIKATSLCGLGQAAPNPILATIRYFRKEYEEHINERFCGAAVCPMVTSPCQHLCPAGVEAHRYIRLCKEGRFAEALAVIRERLPFPGVLSWICHHPCEKRCTRGKIDEPIAIRALERIAWENDDGRWRERERRHPPTGKRVAIIGSGPAGLTCAYYLSKLGHEVTVFEALPEPGGMMRVGIPSYRLPREVLDREIAEIERVGVVIKTGIRIESADELFGKGYQAVFIAVGAHKGERLKIDGEEHIVQAVEFLRRVNLGERVEVGEKVAVIGGENIAIDAARLAKRLGGDVTIIYQRTKEDMSALKEGVEGAEEEGIKMLFLAQPTKIWRKGDILKMEMVGMREDAWEDTGRRKAVPIPDSQFIAEFDTIIGAVGRTVDIPEGFSLPTKGGLFISDPKTMATPISGVFAGGDCVSGPSSVVEAIACGRKAASAIDRFLGGEGDISERLLPPGIGSQATVSVDESEKRRVPIPKKRAQHLDFSPIELGYTPQLAIEEARRCLDCDLEQRE